jgi:PAS domain S-box-containing protein
MDHGHQQRDLPADWGSVILDSVADGVFTVDHDWRITFFNRVAEQVTGISRNEAIGRRCCDVFRASICERDCALRQTMQTDKAVVGKAIYIVNADGQRIPISISTALLRDGEGRIIGGVETFRDLSLVEQLRKELSGRSSFADIVSGNHEIWQIFRILPAIAESNSTVLIVGPSGSGKELFAKAIHGLSPRSEGPWLAVHCGALPDTLLESELFGYVAGAFTDARKDKPGRFARAEGGTLFLDEIGDISPAMQVRLLRVLQDGHYEPLGSTKTAKANVRVITATNQDLEKLVKQGRFRSDLYYRINVVKITLPPLSRRREDIPLLVEHFITRFNQLRGKDISGVSDEVMEILMRHNFPGNVRELENIIEHAFVLCPGGLIQPEHLPDQLRPDEQLPRFAGTTLAAIEARYIAEALERNNWNRSAAARQLGIHKTTLWRKIKNLGIATPAER